MASLTYNQAIRQALEEVLDMDPRAVILGEDVARGRSPKTQGLVERFGAHRVLNTPTSESAFVGLAVGAAISGLRPIAEVMFCSLLPVAWDQVANQMAKLRYMSGGQATLHLVVRTIVRMAGSNAAQHQQSLEALLMHTPGLKVVMPSGPRDAKGLFHAAFADPNPVFFLECGSLGREDVPEGPFTIPLGQAAVKREGSDVTVVAVGVMVPQALEAAEELASVGVSVEVVDPRSLAPLDMARIFASVAKTHRVVVAHEATRTAGAGAEIAAQIAEDRFYELDAPVKRVAAADVPMPFNATLNAAVVPAAADIVGAVRELLD